MQDQAPAPRPDEGRPPDGLTPAEAALQRKMKVVVAGLGVLILLAFAGVVFGMVQRASQVGKTPAGKTDTSGAARPSAAGAVIPNAQGPVSPGSIEGAVHGRGWTPDIRLALPPGSVVKATALHGSTLAVHHEGPAGTGITLVDLATGQVVSRVTVDATAPPR